MFKFLFGFENQEIAVLEIKRLDIVTGDKSKRVACLEVDLSNHDVTRLDFLDRTETTRFFKQAELKSHPNGAEYFKQEATYFLSEMAEEDLEKLRPYIDLNKVFAE